jgi:hypothetical protein
MEVVVEKDEVAAVMVAGINNLDIFKSHYIKKRR